MEGEIKNYSSMKIHQHSFSSIRCILSVNQRLKRKSLCVHGHRCIWYLRCQPPHGFFLTSPHLRGPGTAASSQGAMRGLGLSEREPLSIWTQDNNTVRDSSNTWHIHAIFSHCHSQNKWLSETVQHFIKILQFYGGVQERIFHLHW